MRATRSVIVIFSKILLVSHERKKKCLSLIHQTNHIIKEKMKKGQREVRESD